MITLLLQYWRGTLENSDDSADESEGILNSVITLN